jgi:hypothetical protein
MHQYRAIQHFHLHALDLEDSITTCNLDVCCVSSLRLPAADFPCTQSLATSPISAQALQIFISGGFALNRKSIDQTMQG